MQLLRDTIGHGDRPVLDVVGQQFLAGVGQVVDDERREYCQRDNAGDHQGQQPGTDARLENGNHLVWSFNERYWAVPKSLADSNRPPLAASA